MKRIHLGLAVLLTVTACSAPAGDLKLNDLGYFERQGVNVLVFSNPFTGGFNDEKDSGIEIIHHGVRTFQGGAVRLGATPEQWDLVPKMTSRTVDTLAGCIEVGLRYDDYDFDSRVTVRAQGPAVEISVYLDKPVPDALVGEAG
ncbi:MAG: glycoside hydrolase, partial [Bacteroidales bacterium]|nr:glycoside hydrolase [Bacteroidales bacterium]